VDALRIRGTNVATQLCLEASTTHPNIEGSICILIGSNIVENRRIIGMKIIDVSKRASIRVLMWEILIETHYRNE